MMYIVETLDIDSIMSGMSGWDMQEARENLHESVTKN